MIKRSCDGCTKCCEGWLQGEAYGHNFFPGRPCFFLGKKCTIYENRPETPCRTFNCEWVANDTFPAWMKPDLVNVIITKQVNNNIIYYEIAEAGSILDPKVLSWLFQWAINNKHNIVYYLDGGRNCIGSREFMQLIDKMDMHYESQ
jgi:hypothetical protein